MLFMQPQVWLFSAVLLYTVLLAEAASHGPLKRQSAAGREPGFSGHAEDSVYNITRRLEESLQKYMSDDGSF